MYMYTYTYRFHSSRKVEKTNSSLKTHLTTLSRELQSPWTELLPLAWAHISAIPLAPSFLSPFELIYERPLLLGKFFTASPLLGVIFPRLTLLDTS